MTTKNAIKLLEKKRVSWLFDKYYFKAAANAANRLELKLQFLDLEINFNSIVGFNYQKLLNILKKNKNQDSECKSYVYRVIYNFSLNYYRKYYFTKQNSFEWHTLPNKAKISEKFDSFMAR